MENILKKIVEKKKNRIIQLKKDYPINELLKNIVVIHFHHDLKHV